MAIVKSTFCYTDYCYPKLIGQYIFFIQYRFNKVCLTRVYEVK